GWSRGTARWAGTPPLRRVALACMCAALTALAVPSFAGSSTLQKGPSLNVGGATLLLTRGVGAEPAYFRDGPDDVTNRASWDDDWRVAIDESTADVLHGSTARPDFAFGFRGKFTNVNSFQRGVVKLL